MTSVPDANSGADAVELQQGAPLTRQLSADQARPEGRRGLFGLYFCLLMFPHVVTPTT